MSVQYAFGKTVAMDYERALELEPQIAAEVRQRLERVLAAL